MPRLSILALGLLSLSLAFGPPAARAADTPADAAHGAATADPAHGGGDAHGGGGTPDILEPQPPLAIWTLVVFVGLLLVLGRFAWGPIMKALHEREAHLEQVLLDSEKARNESEQLLAEHKRLMAQAAEQVQGLLAEARRDAQATSDEIVRKAQQEAEAARARAERDIGTARDQALDEIWTKTADLAVSVAGKVLARDLGQDDHRRLVEMAIQDLPAGRAGSNGHGG